MKYQIIDS